MKSELNTTLQKIKRAYLIETAAATGEGGNSKTYRQRVQKDFADNPNQYDQHYARMLDKAAGAVWVTDHVSMPGQPDLLSINGRVLGQYINYPNPNAEEAEGENEFVKIPTESARITHHREQCIMKLRKAADAGTVAQEDMKDSDEMVRRAGGDMMTKIADVSDAVAAA